MGQFDAQQAQIEALQKTKAPDELKQTLASKSGVLKDEVNRGEDSLTQALSMLTHPKARTYLSKQISKISGLLVQIAQKGYAILRDKKQLELGLTTISALVASLHRRLDNQAMQIQEYQKFQEKEKQVKAFVAAQKEVEKKHDEYREKKNKVLDQRYEEIKTGDDSKSKKMMQDLAPLRETINQEMQTLRQLHQPFSAGASVFSSSFDEVHNLYQELYNKEFKTAEDEFLRLTEHGLTDAETDHNTDKCREELNTIKEQTETYNEKMQAYRSKAKSYANNRSKWTETPQAEKEAFMSEEGGLLLLYVTTQSLLQALAGKNAISDNKMAAITMEIAAELKKTEKCINEIQEYKTGRYVKRTTNLRSEFTTDEDGNVSFGLKPDAGDRLDRDLKEEKMLQWNADMLNAREKAKRETEELKGDIAKEKANKNMKNLAKELGDKGADYISAMECFQLQPLTASALKKAYELLRKYSGQEFSEEDLEKNKAGSLFFWWSPIFIHVRYYRTDSPVFILSVCRYFGTPCLCDENKIRSTHHCAFALRLWRGKNIPGNIQYCQKGMRESSSELYGIFSDYLQATRIYREKRENRWA